MRFLKYLALLSILLLPATYSHAQVSLGIGVGPYYGGYGSYAAGPPACAYGYYSYYPYACAPYGYYGPDWFADGVFIGAGPWYRGYYGRGYRGGYYPRVSYGYGRGYANGYRGGYGGHGYASEGFRGGYSGRSGNFRGGGANFRGGGGGFHGGGGGGFHGGGGHGGGRR